MDELLSGGAGMAAFEELATSDSPHARALRLRAENLGVSGWPLWARGRPGSLVDDVERRDARCLVVDLGSLSTREEQAVAAEAVLATLWRRRTDREPVLVVIDEAHNVCPQKPDDPVTALVTEHAFGSPPRGASSASTCSSRRSGRRRCTRTSSASATTSS